jgi:hypothetical protein
MKRLRPLAILVIVLGVLYLAFGIFSFYHYRKVLQLFAYYGVSDEIQMSVPEIAQTRSQLLGASIEFSIVGIVVLCVGIGLLLAKEWARKIWLVLVGLLTVFHVARLVVDYRLSNFILLERIVEVMLIGALAVLSWRWAWGKTISAKLRDDNPPAT